MEVIEVTEVRILFDQLIAANYHPPLVPYIQTRTSKSIHFPSDKNIFAHTCTTHQEDELIINSKQKQRQISS